MRDMLWTNRQFDFGQDKKDGLTEQCNACSFRFACNGGCPKQRFAVNSRGEANHNYFCESYTMFFRHCGDRMKAMANAVNAGQPAWVASPMMVKRDANP